MYVFTKKEEKHYLRVYFCVFYLYGTPCSMFFIVISNLFFYTLDKLPLDAVPTLKKMILYAAPTKSLRTIASDSDIALQHVSYFLKLLDQNSAI